MTHTIIVLLFGNFWGLAPQPVATAAWLAPALTLAWQDDRDPGDTGTGDTQGPDDDIDDSDEGRTGNEVERLPDGFAVTMTATEQAIGARGEVRYAEGEFHKELRVLVHDLPPGEYTVTVADIERASMTVGSVDEASTFGEVIFREPAEFGTHRYDFDPLGQQVAVLRDNLVQMGALLPQTVDEPVDRDTIDVRVNLIGSGRAPQAAGYAHYFSREDVTRFTLSVGYLPAGDYDLYVDGLHRAVIVLETVDVTAKGGVVFERPAAPDTALLDFDPLEKSIELRRLGELYMTVAFPSGLSTKTDDNVAREFTENGPFGAPIFINADALSLTEDGRLQVLLPHPNTDGWDLSGGAVIHYALNVSRECESLSQTWLVSGEQSYPFLLETDFRPGEDDYAVSITRETETPGADLASPALKINGPLPQEAQVSMASLDRWLLHAPKQTGGFDGQILLINKQPGVSNQVLLVGFDKEGRTLEGAQKRVTVSASRTSLQLYGDGDNALFPSALTDQVSHIGLMEPGHHRGVTVSMTYVHRETGATGRSPEVSLRAGASGSQFTLNPTANLTISDSWDGLAVLNLRCGEPVHLYLSRYEPHEDGELLVDSQLLGTVAPGGKFLYLINDQDFPYRPGTWFALTTGNNKHKVQVLALSGTARVLSGNSPIRIK